MKKKNDKIDFNEMERNYLYKMPQFTKPFHIGTARFTNDTYQENVNWKKRKTRIPWINLILLIMDSLRNLFFLVCDLYINENKQRARYNLED